MKECKYCGTEIKKKATICPNCKKKQTSPVVSAIAAIIVVIIAIAIFSQGSNDSNSSSKKANEEKFDYVVDKQYVGDYGIGYYIEGIVKNKKDKEYSYVQIEFSCYDKDGNNLGSALDNMNNLSANETWKYKAIYMGTDGDVDHCDYKEITSW